MDSKAENKRIYNAIDKILWEEWDPIGVNEITTARDEYQSYTLGLFRLKLEGADKDTIANHLFKIETENMGLTGNIENCKKVADKILGT